MEISVQSGPLCVRCGDSPDAPASTSAGQVLCRTCRLAPPPFVRAVAYGPYQGRLKEAIHGLKYEGLRPAAHRLGQLLAEAIVQLAAEAPPEMLVIPVPLHRAKRADRGFNQARLLAVEALGFLAKTHPQWKLTLAPGTLMRLRATQSQAGLTPRQRRLNVRGAFRVSDPSAGAGKHVLVIDDILTTGATARAAAQALVKAGAENVWVATLSRARRFSPIRQNFAASYDAIGRSDDFLDNDALPGETPASTLQPASMYSENQPSF